MNVFLFGVFLMVVSFVGVGVGVDSLSARPTKKDRAWLVCFIFGSMVAWAGVVRMLVDFFSR